MQSRFFILISTSLLVLLTQAAADELARNEKKPTLLVPAFTGMGVTPETLEILYDTFRETLATIGRFTLVNREQIKDIIEQQKLQMSGMCDTTNCQIEVGKLVSARVIVAVKVIRADKQYNLVANLINITTSIEENIVSEDYNGTGLAGLKRATKRLGYRICELEYPQDLHPDNDKVSFELYVQPSTAVVDVGGIRLTRGFWSRMSDRIFDIPFRSKIEPDVDIPLEIKAAGYKNLNTTVKAQEYRTLVRHFRLDKIVQDQPVAPTSPETNDEKYPDPITTVEAKGEQAVDPEEQLKFISPEAQSIVRRHRYSLGYSFHIFPTKVFDDGQGRIGSGDLRGHALMLRYTWSYDYFRLGAAVFGGPVAGGDGFDGFHFETDLDLGLGLPLAYRDFLLSCSLVGRIGNYYLIDPGFDDYIDRALVYGPELILSVDYSSVGLDAAVFYDLPLERYTIATGLSFSPQAGPSLSTNQDLRRRQVYAYRFNHLHISSLKSEAELADAFASGHGLEYEYLFLSPFLAFGFGGGVAGYRDNDFSALQNDLFLLLGPQVDYGIFTPFLHLIAGLDTTLSFGAGGDFFLTPSLGTEFGGYLDIVTFQVKFAVRAFYSTLERYDLLFGIGW